MNSVTISEEDLRQAFLHSKPSRFSEAASYLEVPVFARSVDLVEYSATKDELHEIEFKLANWQRVLAQALEVRLAFDFLWICILLPQRADTINRICARCNVEGVGVIFYDRTHSQFMVALPAQRQQVWALQRQGVIQYLALPLFDKN
jgi:hypothetical protein